jgi:hypothetical protein
MTPFGPYIAVLASPIDDDAVMGQSGHGWSIGKKKSNLQLFA